MHRILDSLGVCIYGGRQGDRDKALHIDCQTANGAIKSQNKNRCNNYPSTGCWEGSPVATVENRRGSKEKPQYLPQPDSSFLVGAFITLLGMDTATAVLYCL